MTLYRISKYVDDNDIEEREYVRVTDHFAVKAGGGRDALVSLSDSLHATREAAIEDKRQQLQMNLVARTSACHIAERRLACFNAKFPVY